MANPNARHSVNTLTSCDTPDVETVGQIDVDSAAELLFPMLLEQLQKQEDDDEQSRRRLPQVKQGSE